MESSNDNDTWQTLSLATRRLLETCKLTMDGDGSLSVGQGSLILGVESTEVFGSPVAADKGDPLCAAGLNTFDAGSGYARNAPVTLVLLRCSFAQIDEAIVKTIPIDVVNELSWPLSMNEQPCQPMSWIALFSEGYMDMSVPLSSSNAAGNCGWTNRSFPKEDSTVWMILQDFHETITEGHSSKPHKKQKVDRDGDTYAGRTDEKDSSSDGSNVTKRRAAGG